MLEDYGATVTAVATADEALELLERERPDVLVSALAMPDKGGYWLIGRVRDLPPERRGGATPAAALTGFAGPEHRASILRGGSSTTSRRRSLRTSSPGSSRCWR
jgi:CheY-like chemotaxis protein